MVERHIALLKQLTAGHPETEWVLQYSPETFNMAELDVALAMCNTAIRAWDAGPQRPVIINLPTTVEVSTANVFADQIERMDRRLERREHIVLSVHPHKDRGTGVACAQRIEGCLFGNGERSGNVDIVTLALNLYTQGITPGLDFPISQRLPVWLRNVPPCLFIRAIRMWAIWCLRRSLALIRMPSPRETIGEFQHAPDKEIYQIGDKLQLKERNKNEITIFDSSGIAYQDLYIAKIILDKYLSKGDDYE